MLGQIMPGLDRIEHVVPRYARLLHVMPGYGRLGQVRTIRICYSMLDLVRPC
jgi:hypothetical protein